MNALYTETAGFHDLTSLVLEDRLMLEDKAIPNMVVIGKETP